MENRIRQIQAGKGNVGMFLAGTAEAEGERLKVTTLTLILTDRQP